MVASSECALAYTIQKVSGPFSDSAGGQSDGPFPIDPFNDSRVMCCDNRE